LVGTIVSWVEAGAGVRVNVLESYNLRFDYAWADYGRLEQAHRFTISLGF